MSKELICCPFCGSTDGYYTKATLRHRYHYLFNGEPNGESDPEIIYVAKNPYVYCVQCDRVIGKFDRLFANSEKGATE